MNGKVTFGEDRRLTTELFKHLPNTQMTIKPLDNQRIIDVYLLMNKKRRAGRTLAALVSRSPLSPTDMLRTSFWTLISLIGFDSFFSEACIHRVPKQLINCEWQLNLYIYQNNITHTTTTILCLCIFIYWRDRERDTIAILWSSKAKAAAAGGVEKNETREALVIWWSSRDNNKN